MYQAMAPVRRDRRAVPGSSSFDASNPVIYLGTVSGARKARARDGSLVAPLDIDFELLEWPVRGLDVLLVSEPDHTVDSSRLAGVLVRDGARSVIVVEGKSVRVHRAISPTSTTPLAARATLSSDEPNFD